MVFLNNSNYIYVNVKYDILSRFGGSFVPDDVLVVSFITTALDLNYEVLDFKATHLNSNHL